MTDRPEDDQIAGLVSFADDVLRVRLRSAGVRPTDVATLEAGQTLADLVARHDAERVVAPRRHRHDDTAIVLRHVGRNVVPEAQFTKLVKLVGVLRNFHHK